MVSDWIESLGFVGQAVIIVASIAIIGVLVVLSVH